MHAVTRLCHAICHNNDRRGASMATILLVIAAWFGLSGVAAVGWSRFHTRVGPTPSISTASRDRLAA